MSGSPRPPSGAEALLRRAVPPDVAETVLGDLAEEHAARAGRSGRGVADRWYWAEAVRLSAAFGGERVREGWQERRRAGRRRRGSSGGGVMLDQVRRDVAYAVRTLGRAPAFTAIVLLTLALGIGATTAIFSVVDGILLRSLPYPDPDELVVMWADHTRRDGPVREWLSPRDWEDLRTSGVYDEVGIYTDAFFTLTGRGEPVELPVAPVDGHMFRDVLKVTPAVGRSFSDEELGPGGPQAVVLSWGLWQSRFGGDPGIVGEAITLSGSPWTVIGVMPADFRAPFVPQAQMWVNWQIDVTNSTYGAIFIRAIGRLADGVTVEQADARARALSARNAEAFPDENEGKRLWVAPLHDELVAAARPALWVLLGAVGLMLLIVCVNVVNLLLARAAGRQGEFAVRSAVGAGRSRLVRQLLVESLLLAVVGGGLGIALSFLGVELLTTLAPEGTPRLEAVRVDARILAFATGVSLLAGLLFGLLPAIRAGRTDLRPALVEGGRRDGGGRRGGQVRAGLVVAQVGLALVLLVGAGLLIRSFREMTRVDLGFEPESRLVVGVRLPGARYEEADQRRQFFARLEQRLASLPGVESAGAISNLPMLGLDGDVGFLIEGRPMPEPGSPQATWWRRVTPDYFEAMGVELERGRGFTASDDQEAPMVVIINQTFARRYFPDTDPVGQRINVNDPAEPVWREIVGVAENTKHFGIRREAEEATYVPYPQSPGGTMYFVLHTAVDPQSLAPSVRGVLGELDPLLASSHLAPLADVVRGSLAQDRFVMALLVGFAALALLLATIGLYGVIAYSVASRFREIGVRMAMGAGARQIVGLVLSRGLALAAGGIVLGLAGAFAATRLMDALLFGISATDPATFVAIPAILLGVAAVAAWLPARRAGRVDPVTVLNAE